MKAFLRRGSWKFLLFEFLVVFTGIYGAFYLTTLREEQIDRRNQVNYYETFMLNLDYLYTNTEAVKKVVEAELEKHIQNPRADFEIIRQIDFTNNMLIVRSGFEAENFTTIGKDYLASLDRGSNLISLIEKRANILEDETRDFLIYKEGDEEAFRTWYISELQYLYRLLEALISTIKDGAVPETKEIIRLIEANN
jgi:hypothetical protein